MANNPRVPCVLEGARRPDRMDDKTGANFTPEGISIAVGDVMIQCGTPGAGPGPIDQIGDVTITGSVNCQVGFSSMYTASWSGGIELAQGDFTWSLDPNGTDDGAANLTAPNTGNPQEVNFTGAGTVTLRVTIANANATDTPVTADLAITVTA